MVPQKPTCPYYQIGVLESNLYYLVRIVKVLLISLHVSVWCEEPPVGPGPYGDERVGDAGVIKQVLLDRHTALLLVKLSACFTAAEPYIQIAYPLVEDIAIECRLYFSVPHALRVEVKIAAETTGQYDAARKFSAQLCRYRQPVFVIELAFEIVHEYMPCRLRPGFLCAG